MYNTFLYSKMSRKKMNQMKYDVKEEIEKKMF